MQSEPAANSFGHSVAIRSILQGHNGAGVFFSPLILLPFINLVPVPKYKNVHMYQVVNSKDE